jgi:para-nitrobenzyl esterase
VKLSELMSSYWANFAKNGEPSGPGLPEWSSFTAADPKVMIFDVTSGMRTVPNQGRLEALDTYFARRREQARKKP